MTYITTYGYDTENNLTSIKDANNHTTTFTYDAFGRVTKTSFPSTLAETYGYDANNNLTSKIDRKNQQITYAYDQLNRLTQKAYPDSTSVAYTYDDDNRLTKVVDPTGTYQFTFDHMGRLTNTTTSYAFLIGRNFTTAYSYDAASNRTGFTDPESGSTTYAYDTLNRLSTLTPPSAFASGSFGFSYDALSRRTQMTRPNSVTTNYAYDNLSRLTSVLHQLSGSTIDGASYTVDNAGNRTTKTDQRTAVTSNYGYDAIYQLLSTTQGTSTTESYTYDPVGNRLSSLGVSSCTNRARYLDPVTGRFIREDPLRFGAGDANFYSYVSQNPVNYTDPSGRIPIHGNWCGPDWTSGMKEQFNPQHFNNHKIPIDGLDEGCMHHDICYLNYRSNQPCDKGSRRKCMKQCDKLLLDEIPVKVTIDAFVYWGIALDSIHPLFVGPNQNGSDNGTSGNKGNNGSSSGCGCNK